MKTYFNFSRKERIGVISLSVIILMLTILLNVGERVHLADPFDVDESKLEFITLNKDITDTVKDSRGSTDKQNGVATIVDFDPNLADRPKWMSFGFSEKQAESIVNYRSNYGPFRKKEDIEKLYVVSDEMYERLKPHIKINTQPEKNVLEGTTELTTPKVSLSFELNGASREDLEGLNGIGPVYAERILTHRSKIGGFIEMSQVDEIYIGDEAKDVLRKYVTIDPEKVEKLNINTATRSELKALPYSNWEVVARIMKAREEEEEELTDLDFITGDVLAAPTKAKLLNYITFSD